MNLLQCAALFEAMELTVHHAAMKGMEHATKIVQDEAKRVIGEYQPDKGPFAAWVPLTAYTQADRVAKGFTPDDPLLRTGAMRDSIERQVTGGRGRADVMGHVGSDNMIAVYQELGTIKIPARSFLGGAAFSKAHEVKDVLTERVVAVIAGKKAI